MFVSFILRGVLTLIHFFITVEQESHLTMVTIEKNETHAYVVTNDVSSVSIFHIHVNDINRICLRYENTTPVKAV